MLDNQVGANYALLDRRDAHQRRLAAVSVRGHDQQLPAGVRRQHERLDGHRRDRRAAPGPEHDDQPTAARSSVGRGGAQLDLTAGGDQLTNTSSVTNGGSISLSGGATYTQSGSGAETGNPVTSPAATLNDGGAGGMFHLLGSSILAGTIPATQTVTVLGNAGGDASTSLAAGGVTNDGTLVLDNATATATRSWRAPP